MPIPWSTRKEPCFFTFTFCLHVSFNSNRIKSFNRFNRIKRISFRAVSSLSQECYFHHDTVTWIGLVVTTFTNRLLTVINIVRRFSCRPKTNWEQCIHRKACVYLINGSIRVCACVFVCSFVCMCAWMTYVNCFCRIHCAIVSECGDIACAANCHQTVGANELHHHIQLNKLFHWHQMAKGNVISMQMVLYAELLLFQSAWKKTLRFKFIPNRFYLLCFYQSVGVQWNRMTPTVDDSFVCFVLCDGYISKRDSNS